MKRNVVSWIWLAVAALVGSLLAPSGVSAQAREVVDLPGTVYQGGCPTPRPPVRVDVNPQGDGRIQVTVTAGNGTLQLVRFGQMLNAFVTVPPSTQPITSNQEIKPPAGATSWTFLVNVDPSASSGGTPPRTTVPFTVFDGCGLSQPWQTFVGGGATALQSTASISDAQIIEGNSGDAQLALTVKLSVPSSQPVSVNFTTTNGTASAPGDYVAAAGTITFNPGETQKDIVVQVRGDFDDEPDETFTVTLSSPVNGGLGRAQATARIVNDDTGPSAQGDTYTASVGSTLNVAAPGLLANDQQGTQTTTVVKFGGLDASGSVDSNDAGTTINLAGGGSLSVQSNGAFSFTPPTGVGPTFSFRYRAQSLSGQSEATVIVNIQTGPAANNDPNYVASGQTQLSVPEGTGLLANDTRGTPAGNVTLFGTTSPPTTPAGTLLDLGNGGSLTVQANGSFTFTAPTTVTGPFTFHYRLANPVGSSDAVVTVTVARGPVITTTAGATTFSEGSSAVIVDAGLTITNPSGGNVDSVTVVLTNPQDGADEVLASTVPVGGITPTYVAATHTLTLTGPASAADFQTALRGVSYINNSQAPNQTPRVISYQGTAGAQVGNTASKTVNVTSVNDAPVLANFETSPIAYSENAPPVPITTALTVTDADSANLAEATVGITSGCVSGQDELQFTNQNGISGTYTAATCTLVLSGSSSVANYQTAIRSVQYANSSSSPSSGARTVAVQVTDGTNPSNVVSRGLVVTAANSAPAGTDNTVTTDEDVAYTFTVADFGFTDPNDTPPNAFAAVTITTLPGLGTLTNNSVAVTAGQSIPVANITSGLLRFTPVANASGTPYTTFTFQVQDDGGTASGGVDLDPTPNTMTINVTAVPDSPTAVNDLATVGEDSGANAIDVLGNDQNPDSVVISVGSVTQPANGDVVITGGGTGLTYAPDPNYCNTQIGGSADTFTYTLSPGGSIGTVSVTVTCVNDLPSFTIGTPSHTSAEDAGPQSVANFATAITDGDPEDAQTVTFTLTLTGTTDGLTFLTAPSIDSTGTLTYTAAANSFGSATFDVTLGDNGTPPATTSPVVSITITVTPVNDAPTANDFAGETIGNTLLAVNAAGTTPNAAIPTIVITGNLLTGAADVDGPGPLTASFVSGTAGATVVVNADGSFTYSPPPGHPGATDTFTFRVSDGETPTPGTADKTATITLKSRVWYVKNDAAAGGTGRSNDPVGTLAEAEAASLADDYIFVYRGDGTNTGQNAGISLKNGQKLFGEIHGLTVAASDVATLNGVAGPFELVAANPAGRPVIGNGGSGTDISAVLVNNATNTLVRGFAMTATDNGVRIFASGTAVVADVADIIVTDAGERGVEVQTGAGGSIQLSLDSITATSSTGSGIVVDGSTGSGITIRAFSDITVTGDTGNTGINVVSATFDASSAGGIQQVNAGNVLVGASGNPNDNGGVHLTNVQGNLFFDDLDIVTTGGTGLQASGTGGGFTLGATSGLATINANNASALNLSNVAATLPFSTIAGTGGSVAGVNLDGVSGTVSAGAGSTITSSSGTAFRVNSSTANVTYNGTVTATGGTGVSLTGNSGTIAFTGQLNLSTGGSAAFTATGGGTVTSTAASSTLTTTTATALNVNGTNIGAAGLTFQSITSNGGSSNGINLIDTGASGRLTVSGTGGPGSGGTIQNKSGTDGATASGIGIYLSNVGGGVTLNHMQLNGLANFAIRGSNVSGTNAFVLNNSTISGTNGNSATTDPKEGSIRFDNLTGSASMTGVNVSGGFVDNVAVVNTSGTLNRLTLDGVTIGANSNSEGDDALKIEALNTAIVNATIQNGTFTSARGDIFNFLNNGTGTTDLVFTGNTISNNHPAIGTGGGGITIVNNGDGNSTFNISSNSMRDAIGDAVLLVKSTGGSTFSGTFHDNTVGVSGVANSGSLAGNGVRIQSAGQGTVTVAVTNNRIRQYNNFGVEVRAGGGATAQAGAVNVTITGNTIAEPGNDPAAAPIAKNGIHLNGGTVPGDTYQICMKIGGAGAEANNLVGSGAPNNGGAGGEDFRLRQRQSTTVRLPGYAGANTNTAAVIAFVQGNNNGTPSGDVSVNVPPGGGYVGSGSSCP